MKLSNIPLRLTTGAYILNSGLNKQQLDEESAAGLQQMASSAFPQVLDLDAVKFGKLLSAAEVSVGLVLLLPIFPARFAGLVLGAFSAGMLRMYAKTPGMTEADGVRPSAEGTGLAKDVWMAGIATSLILSGSKTRTKTKTVKVPTPVKAGAAAATVKAVKSAKADKADKSDKSTKTEKAAKTAKTVKAAKAGK